MLLDLIMIYCTILVYTYNVFLWIYGKKRVYDYDCPTHCNSDFDSNHYAFKIPSHRLLTILKSYPHLYRHVSSAFDPAAFVIIASSLWF